MHCPKCGKSLTVVRADFVSDNMYYVCLGCSQSARFTAEDEEFNGNNGNGVTVWDFIRCLKILDTRHDEGLAKRRLVKKLLLLCLQNRDKGRFHISLTEPLASAANKIREASGTSECDDMRVLLTGLSLLYLEGALRDRSSAGIPGAPVEQGIPVHLHSTEISRQSLQTASRKVSKTAVGRLLSPRTMALFGLV